MKQLSSIALSTLLMAMSFVFFTSCKKETVTSYIDNPSPTHSEPIIIWFGKTNTLNGCTPNRGFCIEWNKVSMDDWQAYALQMDQGKGQAWATKNTDGSTSLKMQAGTTKISTAYRDTVLRTRLYSFDEDTYIRKDLIDAAYKNAGIQNPPAEIKITRGKYPVEVVNAPPLMPQGGVNKWIIKIEITVDTLPNGAIRITLKVTWEWVEP